MSNSSVPEDRNETAFKLLLAIATAEDKAFCGQHGPVFKETASQDWILDTYAKCLQTIDKPKLRTD